jgi:hypothetical protein
LENNVVQSIEGLAGGWRGQWYRTATSIPSDSYRTVTSADLDETLTEIQFASAIVFASYCGH